MSESSSPQILFDASGIDAYISSVQSKARHEARAKLRSRNAVRPQASKASSSGGGLQVGGKAMHGNAMPKTQASIAQQHQERREEDERNHARPELKGSNSQQDHGDVVDLTPLHSEHVYRKQKIAELMGTLSAQPPPRRPSASTPATRPTTTNIRSTSVDRSHDSSQPKEHFRTARPRGSSSANSSASSDMKDGRWQSPIISVSHTCEEHDVDLMEDEPPPAPYSRSERPLLSAEAQLKQQRLDERSQERAQRLQEIRRRTQQKAQETRRQQRKKEAEDAAEVSIAEEHQTALDMRHADEERLERQRKERIAKLRVQTQTAVVFYQRGLMIRYGLSQLAKLIAIAKRNWEQAGTHYGARLLRLSFSSLVAHFKANQRERNRLEQLQTAMARVHRDRSLRQMCFHALHRNLRMTRAKMLAVHRQHNYRITKRTVFAWKAALSQTRRSLDRKVQLAEPNARRLACRWIWEHWREFVLSSKREKLVDERSEEVWLRAQQWLGSYSSS